MQNNYWAILVKVHFWFKIHSWPAIMVRILNFRFNANIVFPCCIWPGPVRQKRHCPTLVSARCSINVLWISNIVTTLGQYLALFGYPGISRGSATPDIRFSLILTPFLDGTGTFCPSPSAPALLSQTVCPSPSVPDVLSQPFCPRRSVPPFCPGTKRLGLGQKGISVSGVLSHLFVPGQKGIPLF